MKYFGRSRKKWPLNIKAAGTREESKRVSIRHTTIRVTDLRLLIEAEKTRFTECYSYLYFLHLSIDFKCLIISRKNFEIYILIKQNYN